jgi:hypothetical protein
MPTSRPKRGRIPLAVIIAERLKAGNVRPDDPALAIIRAWNRDVYARAAGSALSEQGRAS